MQDVKFYNVVPHADLANFFTIDHMWNKFVGFWGL